MEVKKPFISGKTAFRLIHREYYGRPEVIQYLRNNYMPFDLEEFIDEAILHGYRFDHIHQILRSGLPPLLDSELVLLVGKRFGFY